MKHRPPGAQSLLSTLPWLLTAAALLVFSNGRWVWSPAAWLAPVFLLLFLRLRPRVTGLALGFAVQLVAFFISWQGMIPVPGAWYYLVSGIYAFVYFLPYVVHRLVAPRIRGFASTLVLPSAWVAIELLFQKLITPYGSWVSVAYTQVDRRWLLQLASITGTAGISFVILWSASVIAWTFDRRKRLASARRGVAVYAVVMGLLLAWAGYRLIPDPTPQATVPLAGITPSDRLQEELSVLMQRIHSEGLVDEPAAMARLAEHAGRLNDDLVARTRIAAEGGAQLVAWSEHAGRALPNTEQALVEDVARIAAAHGVVAVLGIGLWDPTGSPPFENKLITIDPQYAVTRNYHKARPITGSETGLIAPGNAEVQILDTDFGRVGVAICHDLDFPAFIRSAGRAHVDLLIGPSSDWKEIETMHHRMAAVRAVENGLTLVRPCEAGISSVVDPFGRALHTVREEGEDGSSFTVQAPIYDIATIYPVVGDMFGYAAGGLLIVLILLGLSRPVEPGADPW